MTRRGGKEASESGSGKGKDERQPVKARWRRFNLVVLEALRKGNHLDEVYVGGAEEKLYTEERGTP